ncbi:MAG: hypothetical protein KGQ49_00780 [Verrucomicrobia bacterium]|nr:hypothetical protein [Verrucomicrobiota bacterium]MBU6445916.1 hypothetical protein [Verrucomicrobiota bacterium]
MFDEINKNCYNFVKKQRIYMSLRIPSSGAPQPIDYPSKPPASVSLDDLLAELQTNPQRAAQIDDSIKVFIENGINGARDAQEFVKAAILKNPDVIIRHVPKNFWGGRQEFILGMLWEWENKFNALKNQELTCDELNKKRSAIRRWECGMMKQSGFHQNQAFMESVVMQINPRLVNVILFGPPSQRYSIWLRDIGRKDPWVALKCMSILSSEGRYEIKNALLHKSMVEMFLSDPVMSCAAILENYYDPDILQALATYLDTHSNKVVHTWRCRGIDNGCISRYLDDLRDALTLRQDQGLRPYALSKVRNPGELQTLVATRMADIRAVSNAQPVLGGNPPQVPYAQPVLGGNPPQVPYAQPVVSVAPGVQLVPYTQLVPGGNPPQVPYTEPVAVFRAGRYWVTTSNGQRVLLVLP